VPSHSEPPAKVINELADSELSAYERYHNHAFRGRVLADFIKCFFVAGCEVRESYGFMDLK